MINPEINQTKDRKITVSYVSEGSEGEFVNRHYIDIKLTTNNPVKGNKRGLSLYNRYSLNEFTDLIRKGRDCLQRHCISLNK